MQRSCIILIVTAFLLLPIYIFATPILKWLGQEDDIANEAGKFTLQIIPQLFSLAINFPAEKFLQAQRKVKVLAWIAVLALVIHIGMLTLFMYVFDWGTLGAAVSFNLTRWGISIAQAVYIMGWCKEGWTGFSWLAFNEIWAFVRLSLASAVMLCLEIWYMMSILILTGGLSDAVIAVGSLSICMNINGWETMLFVGINAAIRCCNWRWMAGNGCLYKLGLLLHFWTSSWIRSLPCCKFRSHAALQTILLLIILYKTNWNKEVEQATNRVRNWGGQDIKTGNGAEST
ncbi:protein TRANSPARENT TESTA 12-like [Pyrus ussuriensis x Pyrus communis]|uniref:Protein TRANSPARENT TESTA 12-like n=1 Tax=Pyrus ussuriensis x Pyrus communis TaxID=2448454 RepID=A0A5N5FBP2_9ROSA|nr:protein TRANSPARENT TESTA 12-like [Pyrus ussuriensis x Pyrus communis]